jgi:hypothetical protein
MENGLLHLHSLLRWVILGLLLLSLFQALGRHKAVTKTSLLLLIASHITLLIGLYQYFTGAFGFKLFLNNGVAAVMKDSAMRFWAVEHIFGMILAIVLITIARGKAKSSKYAALTWLYLIALVVIVASVPWPIREVVARPWFPGME